MGIVVVECPKGHIRATRSPNFRCHARLFNTEAHLLERRKAPPKPPATPVAHKTRTPTRPTRASDPMAPTPFSLEATA